LLDAGAPNGRPADTNRQEWDMRIYLAQHGLAVPKEADPEHPLSERGRADVRRLADLLSAAGVTVERALHSGKTRAAQTAELLAQGLGCPRAPEARSGLAPRDPLESLSADLAFWTEDTLVVGHLPYLGRLTSLLLCGDPDRPVAAFRPGSLVCLEREGNGGWLLAWMIRPDLLAP
jgi:phosphohistidine phosphatase